MVEWLDFDEVSKTVDVVMLSKFANFIISTTEVIITSILWGFDQRKQFFEGYSWFKAKNLWLALGMAWTFYTSQEKVFKLKVRKFYMLISTFEEVTVENLVEGLFLPALSS